MTVEFPRNISAKRHDITKSKKDRDIIKTGMQTLTEQVTELEVPEKGTPVSYNLIGDIRLGGVILNNEVVISGVDAVNLSNMVLDK